MCLCYTKTNTFLNFANLTFLYPLYGHYLEQKTSNFGENARFCSVCGRYEPLAGFELKKSKLDDDQKTGKEYHTFIKGGRNNDCTLSVRE